MYREMTEKMLAFVSGSPTAFHAVRAAAERLEQQGFRELQESAAWTLERGGRYFVCRNGSSLIAFQVGSSPDRFSFRIAASHTDSPTFRLKENAERKVGEHYIKLNTEGYGGMICSTWMDRPLSVAGRAIVREADGTIAARLVDLDRDLVLIPSVAIHMNRDVNDSASFNMQTDMMPLFAGSGGGSLMALVAESLGVEESAILDSDLYLYIRERPAVWGCSREFISSGRLDDLQCVFSTLEGFLSAEAAEAVNVMACFDNEEVGSLTRQGADSTFLYDVLRRISLALGKSEEEYLRALSSSFMLSADNAHAVHPNHPEHTDVENCVYMNEGVVLKVHAGQKYTSDGMSAAIVRELARKAGVPLQYFANRSDKKGGSTLGNIAMAHVSVRCADIGLPQLAMHSGYETAGVKDTWYMVRLLQEFYSSTFIETGSGILRIETGTARQDRKPDAAV